MNLKLLGSEVVIIGNEFISKDLNAKILQIDDDDKRMLMKLESPLIIGEVQYNYVVAKTRLVGDQISELCSTRMIGAGLIWVSDERFDPANPFDTSWWRGGAADITSVKLH